MIKPYDVSTDVYARHAQDQYLGLTIVEGLGSGGALALGIEHIDTIQGGGFLAGSIFLGALACHSLLRTVQYARREGELTPR